MIRKVYVGFAKYHYTKCIERCGDKPVSANKKQETDYNTQNKDEIVAKATRIRHGNMRYTYLSADRACVWPRNSELDAVDLSFLNS